MKTLTIRDLCTRPRQAQKTLAAETEALLTSNGRPVALMISVDVESLDEALEVLRRARALQALREIRREARERGVARLGMKEISSIIDRGRKERRKRLDR